MILDDFSRLAFSYEWTQVVVTPSNWRQALTDSRIDLLFIESAWHGNGGAWRYKLTGPNGVAQELVELLAWCRAHGVPSVFWNKEDPVHYADFLGVARMADQVFTTDGDRVGDYRRDLGHDRVGVLAFAAQPAIHNPIRVRGDERAGDVAFAGMYFAHRHSERRAQMDMLLGAALEASRRMSRGLEIYSRQLGGDARYQFPAPFADRVVGSLEYSQMLTAYRMHKVFLNVNTVTTSPTMCARRVFELAACGTPVVSTPGRAVGAIFPQDEVVQVSEHSAAVDAIRALVNSRELRDRMVHRAQRRIWAGHTYSHRVGDVLRSVGLSDQTPRASSATITAMVSTKRPEQLAHVLRQVGQQRGVDLQLVVLTHGWTCDERRLRSRAREYGIEDVRLLARDSTIALGECLNALVGAAEGDLVAKMDDDDLYAPHYLLDQRNALEYSRADVVGKQAHYVHLAADGLVALRYPEREHRYTDFVAGPTLMMTREVARRFPFEALSIGEDTAFLRAVTRAGGVVYASDRFNFAQVRGGSSHTWKVSDFHVLAGAVVQTTGSPHTHITV